MSVGDVINDIQNIASLGYLTYQPAAGVEVIIYNVVTNDIVIFGANWVRNNAVFLYDGAIQSKLADYNHIYQRDDFKFMISNTYYLRIQNLNAGIARVQGYWGLQTK